MPEVVLITGTRKGIGRHLVDHFLQKDYIVAGCSRDEFEGSLPHGYRHYRADVADERAVVDMMEVIGVVPTVAVKAIRDHWRAEQELDLAARHPNLHAIDIRVFQQVALLDVHSVDAGAEE